jgi:antitoxin YefM
MTPPDCHGRKAPVAIETTYTAARDQLKALMDKVVADREVVLVRRRQGG